MKRKAICPGTYDPITEGHRDVIIRSTKIFDEVVVAVTNNPTKNPLYDIETRVKFTKKVLNGVKNLKVIKFSGLLIDLAKKVNANAIVKGLRAISDFEYEFQMAQLNKKLNPDVETIFLMTNPEYAYLSSSAVKEIAMFGGCIKGLIPGEIVDEVNESFKKD